MADEADIANAYITHAIETALSQRLANTTTKKGAKLCKCGEEIPPARRELGFNLCVPCAEESEWRESQFINY